MPTSTCPMDPASQAQVQPFIVPAESHVQVTFALYGVWLAVPGLRELMHPDRAKSHYMVLQLGVLYRVDGEKKA
jgi:hypothetical protein